MLRTLAAFAGDTARETVSFAVRQCVGYEEIFKVGDSGAGAYVCQLTSTATGLVLVPGGPAGAFVARTAREHTLSYPKKPAPRRAGQDNPIFRRAP